MTRPVRALLEISERGTSIVVLSVEDFVPYPSLEARAKDPELGLLERGRSVNDFVKALNYLLELATGTKDALRLNEKVTW